jgi:hypothetical protein
VRRDYWYSIVLTSRTISSSEGVGTMHELRVPQDSGDPVGNQELWKQNERKLIVRASIASPCRRVIEAVHTGRF